MQEVAAVDAEHLAGNEGSLGGAEEGDGGGDLVGVAGAPDERGGVGPGWLAAVECRVIDRSGATQLTRMPCCATFLARA